MVLLSLENPAWRPGAVKCVCVRACVCLCVCVCVCTVIYVLSLLQDLEYHRGDLRPPPVTPDPFPQTRLLAALSAICLPTPSGLAS